jgi:outer membrane biosynthesis protein TonB
MNVEQEFREGLNIIFWESSADFYFKLTMLKWMIDNAPKVLEQKLASRLGEVIQEPVVLEKVQEPKKVVEEVKQPIVKPVEFEPDYTEAEEHYEEEPEEEIESVKVSPKPIEEKKGFWARKKAQESSKVLD